METIQILKCDKERLAEIGKEINQNKDFPITYAEIVGYLIRKYDEQFMPEEVKNG